MGKSELVASLDNTLILDTEDGLNYVDALKVDVSSPSKLRAVIKLLKKGHSYDAIAVDTVTKLEEIVRPLALELYKRSPSADQAFLAVSNNVLELPRGLGYMYLRQAFAGAVEALASVTDRLILIGHIRDKYIDKDGREVSASDVDLTGKIRSSTCSWVDAIGRLERRNTNEVWAVFDTSEQVICGSRAKHLVNTEFILSRLEDDGTLATFWDRVYLPETAPSAG